MLTKRFRAKRKDDDRWVYGYYCMTVEHTYERDTYPNLILPEYKLVPAIMVTNNNFVTLIPVDGETVGQLVGYTTAGDEIYEGDIIRVQAGFEYQGVYQADYKTTVQSIEGWAEQIANADVVTKLGDIYDTYIGGF